ncbi:hypothetical protein [Bradyrhizobium sp. USDA 10063]
MSTSNFACDGNEIMGISTQAPICVELESKRVGDADLVFFVPSHLSGLRVVLIAHGVDRRAANRLRGAGVAISAAIISSRTIEENKNVGFEVRCDWWHCSLSHHAAGRATITIVYRLYGER